MSLTSVDYFMCLGITISRIGVVVIVARAVLRHLDAAVGNTLIVLWNQSSCVPRYTRLQGNLQANLCLRVEGSCQRRDCRWKQNRCWSFDVGRKHRRSISRWRYHWSLKIQHVISGGTAERLFLTLQEKKRLFLTLQEAWPAEVPGGLPLLLRQYW